MTLEEKIKHLAAGGKLRKNSWRKESYIHFKDGILVDQEGEKRDFRIFDYVDEIYTEPKPKLTVWRKPMQVACARQPMFAACFWFKSKEEFEQYYGETKTFGEWESMEIEL